MQQLNAYGVSINMQYALYELVSVKVCAPNGLSSINVHKIRVKQGSPKLT